MYKLDSAPETTDTARNGGLSDSPWNLHECRKHSGAESPRGKAGNLGCPTATFQQGGTVVGGFCLFFLVHRGIIKDLDDWGIPGSNPEQQILVGMFRKRGKYTTRLAWTWLLVLRQASGGRPGWCWYLLYSISVVLCKKKQKEEQTGKHAGASLWQGLAHDRKQQQYINYMWKRLWSVWF